jgi:hypothetical protein
MKTARKLKMAAARKYSGWRKLISIEMAAASMSIKQWRNNVISVAIIMKTGVKHRHRRQRRKLGENEI